MTINHSRVMDFIDGMLSQKSFDMLSNSLLTEQANIYLIWETEALDLQLRSNNSLSTVEWRQFLWTVFAGRHKIYFYIFLVSARNLLFHFEICLLEAVLLLTFWGKRILHIYFVHILRDTICSILKNVCCPPKLRLHLPTWDVGSFGSWGSLDA